MQQKLKIISFKGKDSIPYIPDLAKLRIEIFKNYPYLYIGDMEYETDYLQTYVDCPESVIVVVFDEDKVVGASTAIPLEFETDQFKKPFIEHDIKVPEIFYFGESVLLPAYRGQKIYRQFFQERETAARQYGSKIAAFCEIKRAADDSRRPKDYIPLDKVWRHFGYEKHPELCMYYEWKEIGEETMSAKPLIFWLKKL